ncbi:MAG TPA: histidine--tRNA ligase [Gammaproteobacteria bacterium]|nr:histidine--tRNA ligase [Gammaproteobacteria bacterium]
MMTSIQAVKGMNDILPEATALWHWVENHIRTLFFNYGYEEIRLPILERTELFKRSIGEATDIVEKEMYTFLDRNDESLTLRPEGTAGCVRAGIQQGILYHQTQKLWYQGPMFRYERPQKGRYRQFYQVGVEVFGFAGYLIEAELMVMSFRLWNLLGIADKVKLHINTLGTPESRVHYRKAFVEFCKKHPEKLDEDSKRRLETNPLRILDSKNPEVQALLDHAPKLTEYLDEIDKKAFQELCELLRAAHIPFEINPKLVRGLDYYTGTVFEWVTEALGAQGTVCAGGRYDGLVKELGGKETPAVGFAIGIERIVELCSDKFAKQLPDVYFVLAGERAEKEGLILAEKMRDAIPTLSLIVDCSGGNVKAQFKRADKSGAKFALILGEDELTNNMITFKDLREEKPQQRFSIDESIKHVRSML